MSRKDGAGTADTVSDSVEATGETQPAALARDATQPGTVAPSSTTPVAYESLVTVDRTHYVMGRAIARGGMGRISSAHDRRLGRDVAIKEVLGRDDSLMSRFEREARITARLQHPAIVPLYEAGRWPSGEPFYAMKLVRGEPLDKIIASTKTLAARLALLPNVIAVVDALAYAHAEGVIHRDLKPSNVLLGAFGETVVIDWGLAKDIGSSERDPSIPPRAAGAGETVGVLGTPAYMPPEQAAGDVVDARADVYALGALLYHVLAGTAPYSGQTADEMLEQVMSGPPVALADRVPDAPADLLAIVARAMAREPAARFATAKEMAEELKRFQTGQLVASHRYSASELVRRWIRRHRGIAATLAIALVVAAMGSVWFLSRERTLRTSAEHASQEAKVARDRAEDVLASNFLEQGRVEMIAGRPGRAAPLLAAAYVAHSDEPIARLLMARSLRDVERRLAVFEKSAGIWTAVLSPDNARLATTGANKAANVWDVRTGTLIATLPAGPALISKIAFTPDGTRIVTTNTDENAIKIWDVATGAPRVTLPTGSPPIYFDVSTDGTRIVAPNDAGTATIWDASTGAVLFTLRGHTKPVKTVAFSSDGERVATASDDHTAKIWDARTGALLLTLAGHQATVWSAAFSRDGVHIVTASHDHSAKVWDGRSGTLLATLVGHTAELQGASFSPDGTQVLTSCWDETARIWKWTGEPRVIATFDRVIRGELPELSPDGTKLVTSWGQTARIWDARSGALLATLDGHTADVLSAKWSSDGSRVVTAGDDGTAQLWDARIAPPMIITTGVWLRSASWSADGARVVTVAGEQSVNIWNARSGQLETTLDHAGAAHGAAFSPDGREVVTANDDGTATRWDAHTGTRMANLVGHTASVRSVAFSSDGLRIVTASIDRTANIWDARSGALILTLQDTQELHSAVFSPDGERVVTGGRDGNAKVRDARTGNVIAELPGSAFSVAFSPDGEHVVTTPGDYTAKIWNAQSGQLIVVLEGHEGSVETVSYSSDGSRIVTASWDNSARVWDARTGALLATLAGHTDDVWSAAFSPDGSQIVTAGRDGTARIWDVHLETRPLDAITRIIESSSAWQVVDGLLTRRSR